MRRLPQILAIVGALLIVSTAVFTVSVLPQTGPTERVIAAVGDIGITMEAERNIDRAITGGAQGLLGLGDYNYDYSLRGWHAMAQPLTSKGAWFALGNHDDLQAFKTYMPGGSPQWSRLGVSGVRIVAINTEESMAVGTPQYTWLSQELGREPASAPKILVSHKNWWLGPAANHPAAEFPGNPAAMDALIATNGVDLVLAAHEHNYQRTQRNAVPYLIVGTGGEKIASVAGSDPNTVAVCACVGHVLLTLSSTQIGARFVDVDGVERDVVNVEILPSTSPSPTPSGFQATFKNVRGNKYWVETEVDANKALAGVDARVNGGTWQPLSKQSWGSWAKSITVPAGAEVQFRARANTGESVLSDSYTWPPGATTFSATFMNPRGNEWWVEVDVDATRELSGVDMRKDSGAWIALAKKDWGSWAVSTHVPPGTNVQFRATSTTDDTALSSTYVWPPG